MNHMLAQSPREALADDENHRRLRRISAPGFSEKSVALQEDYLERHTTLSISRVREESSREGKVDFVYWINALTTDIIGELAFGQSFGGLESGKTHPWLHAVFGGIKIGFLVGELPSWMVKFAILCPIRSESTTTKSDYTGPMRCSDG